MILIEQNIANLTGLWKLAGEKSGMYKRLGPLHQSFVFPGCWPNKIWVEGEITPHNLSIARALSFGKGLRLAIWDQSLVDQEGYFSSFGFEKEAELVGMSLDASEVGPYKTQIELVQISDLEGGITWSTHFKNSFSYQILPKTILGLKYEVGFFLAKIKNQVFGTCMLYFTEDTVGIYSFGIIPKYRGQSLAGPFLESVLNHITSRERNAQIILQASEMGIGIYLKYGFKKDFLLRFFR
ncbi:GNAT family N-acetyltransferase [Algoriphagus sp. AK58]|uniref:GNAT family N-acetyltransferase n=1 Tax=Algoriphagus sp. AK58 TaxID=1406877 RepID=UPI00164F2CAC|nr:GNAT family N-acetyltransferase [Algoriphagus sp. AK58]MBC6366823.1 hypothetical protein [Algoriphagus sp. AK58]